MPQSLSNRARTTRYAQSLAEGAARPAPVKVFSRTLINLISACGICLILGFFFPPIWFVALVFGLWAAVRFTWTAIAAASHSRGGRR